MNITKSLFAVFVFLFFQASLQSQDRDRVSVTQETQVLSGGTKSIFKCDIYYNKEKDVVVTHHFYPAEFIKMSNRLGELKIYFPETNTVSVSQSQTLSTTNELLYYFINNKVADLGLTREGFKLISSIREGDLMITRWQAPASLKIVNQVKIVFKNMLPVYAEYAGLDGHIMKKIYYSRYNSYESFSLPLRITEISFESRSDSTIRLSVFSNVRTAGFPDNNYFNFQIPDNAKIAK
jgi:hypothetical protein